MFVKSIGDALFTDTRQIIDMPKIDLEKVKFLYYASGFYPILTMAHDFDVDYRPHNHKVQNSIPGNKSQFGDCSLVHPYGASTSPVRDLIYVRRYMISSEYLISQYTSK